MDRRAFCLNLKEALMDEGEAGEFYKRLAEMAPDPGIADAILCIREDELKHRAMLERIQRRYCQE
ncbi:MAG: ferritin-like domain-containing protein [Bacillota bacterium]